MTEPTPVGGSPERTDHGDGDDRQAARQTTGGAIEVQPDPGDADADDPDD